MRTRPALRSAAAVLLPVVVVAAASCSSPEATEHLAASNAIGPYSAAVVAGDFVFVAGKGGDPAAPFKTEVNGAIDAVEADLGRLGLTLADAVSVNVFVTDMARFGELNEIYAARFQKPYPARTTVGVASLPKGMHVELQVVARRR